MRKKSRWFLVSVMSDISFNCTLNEKMLQDSFRSTLEECFGMLASVYSLKGKFNIFLYGVHYLLSNLR